MPNRPELPTFFQHRLTVYDVLPDSKPMTWSVWDSEGWVGDIGLAEHWSGTGSAGETCGPFDTWQDAVSGMLDNRP